MVDSNPRTHDFCDRLKARLLGTVSGSKTRACRGWKCYGGLSCQTPLMQVTQMPQNAPRNGCGRKVRRALPRRRRKVRASQPVLASPRPSGHHRCCSTTTAASWGPLPATHAVRAGLQEPRPRGRTDTVLRLESWSLISIFFEGLKALPKINVVNHLFFFKNLSLETRCFQT